MSLEVVIVSTPTVATNLNMFREAMNRARVRAAGQKIMGELVAYARTSNILDSSRGYVVLINRPDGIPFRTLFEQAVSGKFAQIETQRRGSNNELAVELSPLEVQEIWRGVSPRKLSNVIIVDSCIARGTTFATQFLPNVQRLTDSVEDIVYFVILAAQPGLRKIDEASQELAYRVKVITAWVDADVNPLGFIVPGVGPDDWTKRITEKMGVTPLWQELGGYPLSSARQALTDKLNSSTGRLGALYLVVLWLVWLARTNAYGRPGFQWLTKATHVINNSASRVLGDISPKMISSVVDALQWSELIKQRSWELTYEGSLYLEQVVTKVLKIHPVYGPLADALETLWPKLRQL